MAIEVQNFVLRYDASWNFRPHADTAKLSNRVHARLVRDAQRQYLDGYGLDWSQFDAEITLSEGITAQIDFTHRISERVITLTEIYFNERTGEILQAGTQHGNLTL